MGGDDAEKPVPPELPKYLLDPLEKQSPERLAAVANYAQNLADWKRDERARELERREAQDSIDDEELADLEERGVSTDPADYDVVPGRGAYITVKEPKPGYHYYYWQWREGDSWKNEYIAPVNPK